MFKFEVGDKILYREGQYFVVSVGLLTLRLKSPTGSKIYAGISNCKLVPPAPAPHRPWVPFEKAFALTREEQVQMIVTDAIDRCMEK